MPDQDVPRHERVHEPESLAVLARAFRTLNRSMVLLWRLGFGRWADAWPSVGGRILVVEHVGRRSGTLYRTPLNYSPVDGGVLCIAAFGPRADWYRNVMAAARVELWLPDGRWHAEADDVSDHPDRLPFVRSVLLDSGFAAPAFGLAPTSMDDAELAAATADYRVVRFTLEERLLVDADDLAWLWGFAAPAAALATALIARRRRRAE